jgi:hypothetical protein
VTYAEHGATGLSWIDYVFWRHNPPADENTTDPEDVSSHRIIFLHRAKSPDVSKQYYGYETPAPKDWPCPHLPHPDKKTGAVQPLQDMGGGGEM